MRVIRLAGACALAALLLAGCIGKLVQTDSDAGARDWKQLTWTHRAPGVAWSAPGGDVGALVRDINAGADMHDRGFNKAAPSGFFDLTAYLQKLQSAR